METPINQMTLDEVKEQVAQQFTGGKHTWSDGYLNKPIKVVLMDSVAKIYASQFETKIEKLEADKAELLEALEKCWEIIPLDSRKWNDVFLEVDEFLKK